MPAPRLGLGRGLTAGDVTAAAVRKGAFRAAVGCPTAGKAALEPRDLMTKPYEESIQLGSLREISNRWAVTGLLLYTARTVTSTRAARKARYSVKVYRVNRSTPSQSKSSTCPGGASGLPVTQSWPS